MASQVAEATGGSVDWLVLGDRIDTVTANAARFAPVLAVESPLLTRPTADSFSRVISAVAKSREFDLITAASSTFSKDILPRASALLGGAMASDVIGHEVTPEGLQFECPQFAGAVIATIQLFGFPQVVTVRATAYPTGKAVGSATHTIERLAFDATALRSRCEHLGLHTKPSSRPDVTEARIVVSGRRAVKNADDFERLAGKLADSLGGAVGSSRALVDAGITSNGQLVGQTGKIVAPELYIALGISGAVQHLAGMKNSRTIVAINRDPDAPIFEVADYGLVGDIYQLVPELIEKLRHRSASNLKGATPHE